MNDLLIRSNRENHLPIQIQLGMGKGYVTAYHTPNLYYSIQDFDTYLGGIIM
ncbi:MAG TPA: hypothetical protein V6C78_25330 [Crinalium sp.]